MNIVWGLTKFYRYTSDLYITWNINSTEAVKNTFYDAYEYLFVVDVFNFLA